MDTNHPHLSDDEVEALVLRRLRGELDAQGDAILKAALAADPARAERARALERSWQKLELPPVAFRPVAGEVLAKLRAEAAGSRVPAWAQWAAAAALCLGLGAGWELGLGFEPPAGETAMVAEGGEGDADLPSAEAADLWGDDAGFSEPGLGESLWLAAGAESEDDGELQ